MSSARERLTRFYEHYNPDCLSSVDAIVDIYKGREEEIFTVLEEKYGPEPKHTPTKHSQEAADSEKDEVIRKLTEALREKTRELAQVLSDRSRTSHPRTALPTEEVKRLASLLEQERTKNGQLEARLAQVQDELYSAQSDVRHLEQRVAQDGDSLDELRKAIEDFNENELVLLRELGSLKLLLGDDGHGSAKHDTTLSEWESRVTVNFQRRITELEREMQYMYDTAQLEIRHRDEKIRSLTCARER